MVLRQVRRDSVARTHSSTTWPCRCGRARARRSKCARPPDARRGRPGDRGLWSGRHRSRPRRPRWTRRADCTARALHNSSWHTHPDCRGRHETHHEVEPPCANGFGVLFGFLSPLSFGSFLVARQIRILRRLGRLGSQRPRAPWPLIRLNEAHADGVAFVAPASCFSLTRLLLLQMQVGDGGVHRFGAGAGTRVSQSQWLGLISYFDLVSYLPGWPFPELAGILGIASPKLFTDARFDSRRGLRRRAFWLARQAWSEMHRVGRLAECGTTCSGYERQR